MNRPALEAMKRVVLATPEDRLHMRRVYEKAECGTAGCLLGLSSLDPEFRDLCPKTVAAVDTIRRRVAFGMDPVASMTVPTDADFEPDGSRRFVGGAKCFSSPVVRSFEQAAIELGIAQEDADILLGDGLSCARGDAHAVSRAEVLWNIDRLLAGDPPLPYTATNDDVPLYAGDDENPSGIDNHDHIPEYDPEEDDDEEA